MVETSADRPWVQFRLRHVMVVLAAAAVAAAVVARVTRDWPPQKQLLFAGGLGALCLTCLVPLGLSVWRRRHVQRAAGPLLLREVRAHPGWWMKPWMFRTTSAFVALMPVVLLVWAWYDYVGFDHVLPSGQPMIVAALYGSQVLVLWMAVLEAWWGPTFWFIEFRQRGLLLGTWLRFLSWSDVLRHDWQPGAAPKLRLVLTRNRTIYLPFRPEQQAAVEHVVAQCLGGDETEKPAPAD